MGHVHAFGHCTGNSAFGCCGRLLRVVYRRPVRTHDGFRATSPRLTDTAHHASVRGVRGACTATAEHELVDRVPEPLQLSRSARTRLYKHMRKHTNVVLWFFEWGLQRMTCFWGIYCTLLYKTHATIKACVLARCCACWMQQTQSTTATSAVRADSGGSVWRYVRVLFG